MSVDNRSGSGPLEGFFNRQEQRALVLLAVALLVGGGVNLYEGYRPGATDDFRLVPAAVEVPAAPVVAVEQAGPVGLNTADLGRLQTLPGIGPRMARRIVEARVAGGAFRRLEDLRRVKGIGPRTLEKLRPLVEID